MDMLLQGFNLQGGQYKMIAEKKLDNFCKSIYIDAVKSEYEKYYEASVPSIPFGTCPYPAGDYVITNLLLNDIGILPPYIPGGEKWRLDFRYYQGEQMVGGYDVYALVRNEKSIMQGG